MTPAALDYGAGLAAYPAEAVRRIFGLELDPWQAEALRAVFHRVLGAVDEDGNALPNVAVQSGHGVGKSTLDALATLLGVGVAFAQVPCTAPTQHQLVDILWAQIAYWLNVARDRAPEFAEALELSKTRLVNRHYPAAFAVQVVGRSPEALAGFHFERLIYVVDEASGVPDESMAVVNGALTTAGAACLMTGNPTRPTGFFVDAFGRNAHLWRGFRVSSEDCPRVAREWLHDMEVTWGRGSDIYRVRVLGLPPQSEAAAFIQMPDVEAAVARRGQVAPEGRLELGVDVARYGHDRTAIYGRRGGAPVYVAARHGLATPETTAWVADVVREHAIPGRERPIIRVDDNGVGGGVTDQLRLMVAERVLEAEVIAANFGGTGDTWYANAAGVWWGRIRQMMRDGTLALPDDPELRTQLTTRTFAVNAGGKVVLEPKDHMAERGVPSPDLADALVLAYAAGTGQDFLDYLAALRDEVVPEGAEPLAIGAVPLGPAPAGGRPIRQDAMGRPFRGEPS